MVGTVDVAFGRKIDDRARFAFGQLDLYHRSVAEVAPHKDVAGITPQAG